MNTLENMHARFNLLPEDFKQAIKTFDYDKKLQEVGKKFKLHIDQLVILEKAMSDIIFGDLKTHDLVHTLSRGLRIHDSKASDIAMDLDLNILAPLKSHIKKVQETNEELSHPKKRDEESNLREVL